MKKYIAEIDQDELTVRLLERGIKMKRPDGLSGRQVMENIRAQALDGARIPEATILLNRWQRMHWSDQKKYKERLYWLLRATVTAPPSTPLFYSRVHITRGNPPPRPDPDGVVGGAKAMLDCLTSPRLRNSIGLGFILDDNPTNLLSFTADSVTTPPGQGFTEIEIWAPKK